jgi:hypothetical protein
VHCFDYQLAIILYRKYHSMHLSTIAGYKIRFSLRNILAFAAVLFICHELHEISHTAVARMQCGCWGLRDFNVWNICEACTRGTNVLWASMAGPALTYLLIWLGFILMSAKFAPGYQSLGWVLVMANKPFARLFTVLIKGGDESFITRTLFGQERLSITAWIIELVIVLLLIVPPLVRAWKLLHARRRVMIFVGFLLLPMLVEFVLLHKLGNNLLEAGVLSGPGILGSPVLVNLWTGVWVVIGLYFICFPTTKPPAAPIDSALHSQT